VDLSNEHISYFYQDAYGCKVSSYYKYDYCKSCHVLFNEILFIDAHNTPILGKSHTHMGVPITLT